MAELQSHLQRHSDKLDPKLHRHDIILFGEDGDSGIVADVKEVKRGYATMKTIGIAILTMLLGNIILIWAVWLR